jgi:hypothetical protein
MFRFPIIEPSSGTRILSYTKSQNKMFLMTHEEVLDPNILYIVRCHILITKVYAIGKFISLQTVLRDLLKFFKVLYRFTL